MSNRKHHLTPIGFVPPLLTGAVVWHVLREPGQAAGLAGCLGLFVLCWPLAAMAYWSLPQGMVALVTSNRQRARYRKRRKDAGKGRSAPIYAWVRRAVMRADRNRCVFPGCHTRDGLEADHYRPYAGGGLSWIFNLYSLCKFHNDVKSNYWVDEDGFVHYHPYGHADVQLAAKILAAERRHKWNLFRWLRAAWSLAW